MYDVVATDSQVCFHAEIALSSYVHVHARIDLSKVVPEFFDVNDVLKPTANSVKQIHIRIISRFLNLTRYGCGDR